MRERKRAKITAQTLPAQSEAPKTNLLTTTTTTTTTSPTTTTTTMPCRAVFRARRNKLRYLAIAHPIAYSASSSSHRAVITICLVWLISCCVGAPIILGLNTTPERQSTLCILYNSTFIFWSSLTSFYVPCIIMIGFYWRIFSAIRSRAKKVITTAHQQQQHHLPAGSGQSPAGPMNQLQLPLQQQVAVIGAASEKLALPSPPPPPPQPPPLTSTTGGDAQLLQRRSSGTKRQMQSFDVQPEAVQPATELPLPAPVDAATRVTVCASDEKQECLNIARLLKEEKQLKQQQRAAVTRNHLPRGHRHVCCRRHDAVEDDDLSHMSDSLCYHSGSQEEEGEEEDEDDLTSRTSGSSSPASSITSSHYDCSLATTDNRGHRHFRCNHLIRFGIGDGGGRNVAHPARGRPHARDHSASLSSPARHACCTLGCPNLNTPTRLAVCVQNGGNTDQLTDCRASDQQRRRRDSNRKRSSLFSTTICCDSHATSTGGGGGDGSCAKCGGLLSMTTSASFECTSTGGACGLTGTTNDNLRDEDLEYSGRCSHCAASSIVGDVSQAHDSPLRSANLTTSQLNGNGELDSAQCHKKEWSAGDASGTVQVSGMLESARQTIKRRSMRLTQILRGSRRETTSIGRDVNDGRGQQQQVAADQSGSSSSAPTSAESEHSAENQCAPVKALIVEEPSSSGCKEQSECCDQGEGGGHLAAMAAAEPTSVDGQSEQASSMPNVNCGRALATGSGKQLKPGPPTSCSEANTFDRSTTLTATASSTDPTTTNTTTTSGEKLVAAAAASAAVTVATTALNNEATGNQRQQSSGRTTGGTKQIVSSMINLMHKPRSRGRHQQRQRALLTGGGGDQPVAIAANCTSTTGDQQNQQVAIRGQERGVSTGRDVNKQVALQQQTSKQLQQHHHNHQRGNSRRRREKNAARRERKATKTLAIVLGIFLICWTPFFTCNIIDGICIQLSMDCRPGMMVYLVTSWLGYINSCVNPIIYTIFNMEFRRAFKKILTTRPCCCSACC